MSGSLQYRMNSLSKTYVDHRGLVTQDFDPVDPDALHEYLPPTFGSLNFHPSPILLPGVAFTCSFYLVSFPFIQTTRQVSIGRNLSPFDGANAIQLGFGLLLNQLDSFCTCTANTEYTFLPVDQCQREDGSLYDALYQELPQQRD